MKVAHVVSAHVDRITGPRNSVSLLSSYLNARTDVESHIYSDTTDKAFVFNGEKVLPISELVVSSYDIIVFSGVYNKINVALSAVCRARRVPYIISPRSSLVRASLKKSWWKKIPFLIGYGRSYLKGAAAIHFLTEDERDNSININRRSIIVGNIVILEPGGTYPKEKIVGFLGRYDVQHKGLDYFLAGVSLAKDNLLKNGWTVELHGPDFKGGLAKLKAMVKRYGLSRLVELGKPLHGSEKNQFLDRVSVFVHTSRYEGQPQSVMEAMGKASVIMVTPGANMGSVVREARCGEMVDLSSAAIARFLSSLPGDLAALSAPQERARIYAIEQFSGRVVAAEFAAEVAKLLKIHIKES